MQNSVMRVRSSLGLKFRSEFSEKGSALIDTDSRTIARVEVDETLNSTGLGWLNPKALETEKLSTASPAHTTPRRRLRAAKAPILIRTLVGSANKSETEVCATHSDSSASSSPAGPVSGEVSSPKKDA